MDLQPLENQCDTYNGQVNNTSLPGTLVCVNLFMSKTDVSSTEAQYLSDHHQALPCGGKMAVNGEGIHLAS
ncbi:hypothetical protein CW304_15740 [Bacillus sp. UFRGS-B20]|nr:hypothetical protein CW304_15740 [Bacillus sp. UFRGS-B20]